MNDWLYFKWFNFDLFVWIWYLHESSHITPKKPSEQTHTNCWPIMMHTPWLLHTDWSGQRPDVSKAAGRVVLTSLDKVVVAVVVRTVVIAVFLVGIVARFCLDSVRFIFKKNPRYPRLSNDPILSYLRVFGIVNLKNSHHTNLKWVSGPFLNWIEKKIIQYWQISPPKRAKHLQ